MNPQRGNRLVGASHGREMAGLLADLVFANPLINRHRDSQTCGWAPSPTIPGFRTFRDVTAFPVTTWWSFVAR